MLYVAAREVFVYEAPNFNAKKLGYLRAGARVTRSAQAQGFERCAKGFYRIAPEGYVCAGDGARLKTEIVRRGAARRTTLTRRKTDPAWKLPKSLASRRGKRCRYQMSSFATAYT